MCIQPKDVAIVLLVQCIPGAMVYIGSITMANAQRTWTGENRTQTLKNQSDEFKMKMITVYNRNLGMEESQEDCGVEMVSTGIVGCQVLTGR